MERQYVAAPERVLLGFEAVARRIGRRADKSARLYLWRAVKAGHFPAPVQLSPGRIAWNSISVDRWIESRPPVNYAPRPTEAGDAA